MVKRLPLAIPLLLATAVLGGGVLASWFLTRGGLTAVPLAPVGPEEASSPRVEPTGTEVPRADISAVPETPAEVAGGRDEARIESAEERTAVATLPEKELAEAIWVAGYVRFPAATPPGEEVDIVAMGKKFANGETHRARVARDGAFRVAFAKDTRYGSLRLDAPHLYLEKSERLHLSALPAEILLEPEVGGHFRGVVLPPPGVTNATQVLRDQVVQLSCWSRTTSQSVERIGRLDENLRFELRGVPPGMECRVHFDPGCWAPVQESDLHVVAGETHELELRSMLGARVGVRVVEDSGASVKDAHVFARTERVNGRSTWADTRDGKLAEDGSFTIQGIVPGEVTLVAEKEGFVGAELVLEQLGDGDAKEGLELHLASGYSVAGSVVWPDGTIAARAGIQINESATSESGGGGWGFAMRNVTSAADGSFRISGLGEGPFTVRAQASKELAPEDSADTTEPAKKKRGKKGAPWHAEVEHVQADEAALVLVLQPGLAVSGRVVDDAGAPVTRFTVKATSGGRDDFRRLLDGGVSKKFESDDGTFVLEGLEEGRSQLSARATGYVESIGSEIILPRDSDSRVIVLTRVATLSGTVTDPLGRPIENATVHADTDLRNEIYYWDRSSDHSDTTDEEGRFEITDAPTGKVRLVALRTGFASSDPVRVDVAPAQVQAGLSLRLRHAGRLSGDLLPGVGGPVNGREISLDPRDGGASQQTSADAAGHFVLEGLVPGIYEVTAEPSEETARELKEGDSDSDWMELESLRRSVMVTITEGETAHVVLGAPPRAPVHVSGTVRRGTRPAEGAEIWVSRQSSTGEQQNRWARTDASGSYALDLDEAGIYGFILASPSGGTQISRNETIPEGASYTVDFDLPSGRISGCVLGPDRAPLAEASVSIEVDRDRAERRSEGVYGSIVTDAEGRFAFEDLPADSYTVTAGGEQFWSDSSPQAHYGESRQSGLALADGGEITGLEFELSEAATLEGTVRTSSGQLAAGAMIFVWSEQGELDSSWWFPRADASGHYVVSGLSAGSWSVSARLDSEVSEPTRAVRLRSGERTELDLSLRSGTMLHVVVEDSDGKPVGAGVSVRDERGLEYGGMRAMIPGESPADEPSNPPIGPLAPGTYRVTAFNHDGVSAEQSLSVHGEPDREVRLRLGGKGGDREH